MDKIISRRYKAQVKQLHWLALTLSLAHFPLRRLVDCSCLHHYGMRMNVKQSQSALLIVSVSFFITIISFSTATHLYADTSDVSTRHSRNANSNATDSGSGMTLKPEHFIIPVGGVMHLFPRYGYLSLSMKVISKNDRDNNKVGTGNKPTTSARTAPGYTTHGHSSPTQVRNDSWIFLEPVNNVIEPSTLKIEETFISPTNESQSVPFHNLFHIDLCDDIRELMEAYFKNFSIEGLDKPWQAFSGGWRVPSIARYFGIDQMFVEGDFRYILVKVLLVEGSGTVVPFGNITVSPTYKPNFLRFKPNNDLSTYEFFKIHSYILGNAVYQVFVYEPEGFQYVKRRLFYDGIKDNSTTEFMDQLPDILSRWVRHVGRVFVLNSPPEVMESVRNALVRHNSSHPVASLFNLHNNPRLVRRVESLLANQPKGVLGIDLRGIHFLFANSHQRAGFAKALKHKMQLWEINFQY